MLEMQAMAARHAIETVHIRRRRQDICKSAFRRRRSMLDSDCWSRHVFDSSTLANCEDLIHLSRALVWIHFNAVYLDILVPRRLVIVHPMESATNEL